MSNEAIVMTPKSELTTPPVASPIDAEVDVEILKSIPKQFSIDSEETANWLVRRIVNARLYSASVRRWAEREQKRAEREEATLLFLFGRQLEQWSRKQIDKLNGRRKSLFLPSGTIGFRHEKAKLVVDDDCLVLEWARRFCRDAISTIEKLSRTEIKSHFEKTGEVPEGGAHVEPEREKFYIS